MQTKKVKIGLIKPNPNNPRVIKDDKFNKLVQSLRDLPEMADVRPVVVNPDMVVLGGNMRLKAMKVAGWEQVPIVVVDWDEEKQRQFIIKDNLSGGEWDWEMLANQWDAQELADWGLDVWTPPTEDNLSNTTNYADYTPGNRLEEYLGAELKRLFLVFDSDTFTRVVAWFDKMQAAKGVENYSEVIVKLMEDENL